MNHKQKLGYMALGAGILTLGITIGQIITPHIEAQQNGLFDTITCRELKVVDQNGQQAIELNGKDWEKGIYIYDPNGKKAIELAGGAGNYIAILNNKNGQSAIELGSLSDFRLISGQWSLTIVSFFLTFLHKEEGYDETPQTGSPFIRFGTDRNPTGH